MMYMEAESNNWGVSELVSCGVEEALDGEAAPTNGGDKEAADDSL
jgi:hypothetical protein